MKTIGLMTTRNESWILKTTLPQLKRFVDDFIILDGRSTDGTPAFVESLGGTVLPQGDDVIQESTWRQSLLEAGRKKGGTHFIILDADEAFTTNFLRTARQRLEVMKPGEKLVLDWLCLWKDAYKMRVDPSFWSNSSKDFVFCDDQTSEYASVWLHSGRTPGKPDQSKSIRIPRQEGSVLHFQFVPFARFQIKQAYLRCLEWVNRAAQAWEINSKYAPTLDDGSAVCDPIPPGWMDGISHLDKLRDQDLDWFYPAICDFFKKHGILFFEPLQIWHVPDLLSEFRRQIGRDPEPMQRAPLFERIRYKIRRLVKTAQ